MQGGRAFLSGNPVLSADVLRVWKGRVPDAVRFCLVSVLVCKRIFVWKSVFCRMPTGFLRWHVVPQTEVCLSPRGQRLRILVCHNVTIRRKRWDMARRTGTVEEGGFAGNELRRQGNGTVRGAGA